MWPDSRDNTDLDSSCMMIDGMGVGYARESVKDAVQFSGSGN